MTTVASAATPACYELAEGIIWDERADLVRWVDSKLGRVMAGRLDKRRLVDITALELGRPVGAIALCEDDGILLAAGRGLAVIAPDGTRSFGPDLLGARPDAQLNDGSVDPQGRFVVGSISLGGEVGAEVLLRVSPGGWVETIRADIGLSNGIAFSPDGKTIYHVDTLASTISSHSYGSGRFDTSESWTVCPIELPRYPDGLTVSADGSLWVALWGESRVHRYAPTGELLDAVEVFGTQVTCATFVGSDLATVAITTARDGRDDWRDSSGAIFLADVAAAGLPAYRWGGNTAEPYWVVEKGRDHEPGP